MMVDTWDERLETGNECTHMSYLTLTVGTGTRECCKASVLRSFLRVVIFAWPTSMEVSR